MKKVPETSDEINYENFLQTLSDVHTALNALTVYALNNEVDLLIIAEINRAETEMLFAWRQERENRQ